MKMKLTLFSTHFLSLSFLSIPLLFHHLFQPNTSLDLASVIKDNKMTYDDGYAMHYS